MLCFGTFLVALGTSMCREIGKNLENSLPTMGALECRIGESVEPCVAVICMISCSNEPLDRRRPPINAESTLFFGRSL